VLYMGGAHRASGRRGIAKRLDVMALASQWVIGVAGTSGSWRTATT
jgi:hypothetical protein